MRLLLISCLLFVASMAQTGIPELDDCTGTIVWGEVVDGMAWADGESIMNEDIGEKYWNSVDTIEICQEHCDGFSDCVAITYQTMNHRCWLKRGSTTMEASTQNYRQSSTKICQIPTNPPTNNPTSEPSIHPSHCPSRNPSNFPTLNPTYHPTMFPSSFPTSFPSFNPSIPLGPDLITDPPTMTPTIEPTMNPSIELTEQVLPGVLILRGDYEAIVGTEKQLFLDEWNQKYPTTATDVNPGSIVVFHQGTEEQLAQVNADVEANGVQLDSFGTLEVQLPVTGEDCFDIGNHRYQYSHEPPKKVRLTMGENCKGISSANWEFTISGNDFSIDGSSLTGSILRSSGSILFSNGHVYIIEGESAEWAGDFSLGLQDVAHCPAPTEDSPDVKASDEITDPAACQETAEKFGIEYDSAGSIDTAGVQDVVCYIDDDSGKVVLALGRDENFRYICGVQDPDTPVVTVAQDFPSFAPTYEPTPYPTAEPSPEPTVTPPVTGIDCVDIGNKRYQYSHEASRRPRLTMGEHCDGTASAGWSFKLEGSAFYINDEDITGSVLSTGYIIFDNGHVYIPEGESAEFAGENTLGLEGVHHCPEPTADSPEVKLSDEIQDPSDCQETAEKFGIEYDETGSVSTDTVQDITCYINGETGKVNLAIATGDEFRYICAVQDPDPPVVTIATGFPSLSPTYSSPSLSPSISQPSVSPSTAAPTQTEITKSLDIASDDSADQLIVLYVGIATCLLLCCVLYLICWILPEKEAKETHSEKAPTTQVTAVTVGGAIDDILEKCALNSFKAKATESAPKESVTVGVDAGHTIEMASKPAPAEIPAGAEESGFLEFSEDFHVPEDLTEFDEKESIAV